MIDESILPSAKKTIINLLKLPEWRQLDDKQIWNQLVDQVEGEGFDEEILIELFESPDNLKKKIEEENLNKDNLMENKQVLGYDETSGQFFVKEAKKEETKSLDPADVKQKGPTNEPENISSEITRIVQMLNKKLATYEGFLVKSAAFRAEIMDKLVDINKQANLFAPEAPEKEKKPDEKKEEGKKDEPKKKEEGKKDESKKEKKVEVSSSKLDAPSIEKVKTFIQDLESILGKIKRALGDVDEAEESLDLGLIKPPALPPPPEGGIELHPMGEAKRDLKGLGEKGKELKARVEHELERFAWILDKAQGNDGGADSDGQLEVKKDQLDQGVAGKSPEGVPYSQDKKPEATEEAPKADTAKSEEQKKEDDEPKVPGPEAARSEETKPALSEDEQSTIVAYLEASKFIERNFDEIKAEDEIEARVAMSIPVVASKTRIAAMKKALEGKVSKEEIEDLTKFSAELADHVENIKQADVIKGLFLYTDPKADDYKQQDVQKQVAKENIKGNTPSAIKNTSDAIDRKFLSVKAEVEKLLTNKFAKFAKALDSVGEAQYKGLEANPLKSALYRYCKEAGLDADMAHRIIEASYDSSAEDTHQILVKRAQELASLSDEEFLKKASQISRSDRRVASEIVAKKAFVMEYEELVLQFGKQAVDQAMYDMGKASWAELSDDEQVELFDKLGQGEYRRQMPMKEMEFGEYAEEAKPATGDANPAQVAQPAQVEASIANKVVVAASGSTPENEIDTSVNDFWGGHLTRKFVR